jgi:hypothetical protein
LRVKPPDAEGPSEIDVDLKATSIRLVTARYAPRTQSAMQPLNKVSADSLAPSLHYALDVPGRLPIPRHLVVFFNINATVWLTQASTVGFDVCEQRLYHLKF